MSGGLDIRAPVLRDHPGEWEVIDAELLASLYSPTGILTPQQWAALQGIWGRRWFLIRGDTGLVSRCQRCNSRHTYITLACVPRPYNGITEIFGALRAHYGNRMITEIIAFGDIVPITRGDALKLYGQIRAKGFDL